MRTALLLSVASLAVLSAPAEAASILFSDTGNNAETQSVSEGGVTQIKLENGATVSIVGPANFSLRGEEIVIDRGGITVVGRGNSPVVFRFPNDASASITGAGSLTVSENGFGGNVMSGRMVITNGGETQTFRSGNNWTARYNGNASRVLANGAQRTPRNGPSQTVADAAETGLPVTLGEALAGIGASGDVIAASHNLEAYLANPALTQLPSGDVARLIAFSDRLAAALGGASFDGASPALVNAYLQYLASDGQIGAFQNAYAGLVSQYLTLLSSGGFASEYQAADLTALNAYLGYLQTTNGLGRIGAGQQDLLSAYLAFLSGGGVPRDFIAPAGLLNDDAIAAYVAAITAYADFLSAGGNPGDFGTNANVIEAYLKNLAASGLLDQLFGAQSAALSAYLDFIANGGNPADFGGFGAGGPGLSDALAAQYVTAIQAYIAFLQGGGAPGDFQGGADVITTFIQALQDAGLFTDLLGDQASALQAYLDFIDGGGNPGDFAGFGISNQLAQQYAAAVQAYIDFITSGGVPSEFAGLNASVFQAYLEALSNAGLFDTLLSDQSEFLTAYLAFLQGGGNIDDFDLLPGAITVPQKLAAVQSFLAYVRADGVPSEFDGETLAVLRAFYEDSDVNFDFARNDLEGQYFLSEYFRYLDLGGSTPDGFNGLPSNSGQTTTLQTAYSIARSNGAGVESFGAAARPMILDAVNRFAISSSFSGIPTNTSVYQLRNDAVYSELFSNDDLIVGRVTNVRVFNDGPMYTLGANQGAHYALVPLLTALPGDVTVDYGLTYATSPTFADGSSAPGTFDADIRVQFSASGATRLATAGTFEMPGDASYSFSTAGGLDGVGDLDPATFLTSSGSPLIQQSAITLLGTGKACISGTGCTLYMAALPGGADAQFLGVSYETRNGGDTSVAVHGAAAFTEVGGEPDPLPTVSYTLNGYEGGFTSSPAYLNQVLQGTRTDNNFEATGNFSTGSTVSDVELDADGALLSYVRGTTIGQSGTADTFEIFGNDRVLIGRWADGATQGPPFTVDANQGYHYALGAPATGLFAVPVSGQLNYVLGGATAPTTFDNSMAPGVFDAGMTLIFGSAPKVAMEGSITMPTGSPNYLFSFATAGGLANPDQSQTQITLAGTSSSFFSFRIEGSDTLGCGTSATCNIDFQSFFTGDDVGAIGTVYTADIMGGDTRAAGSAIFLADGDLPSTGGSTTPPQGTEVADQIVLYSATTIGIDERNPATVIYDDTTGAPLDYLWELNDFTRENEHPNIGSAQQNESGSVTDLIGWTRWAGGTTGGRYFANNDGFEMPADGGWHVVAGDPATNLPQSGTVQYELIGSTNPTIRDGSVAPGTFTGDLAIAFGAQPKVGIEFDVAIGGSSYAINTPGGVADPLSGGMVLETTGDYAMTFSQGQSPIAVSGNGAVCGGSNPCTALVRGFVSGDGATHAGMVYTFGNTGFDTQVDGSAVFGIPTP